MGWSTRSANAINIVLDPLLIFGLGPFPEPGVTGAAVATTIGRGTGTLYALWRLFGPGGRLPMLETRVAFDVPVMAQIVRLPSTASLQMIIGTASWIGLVRIVATSRLGSRSRRGRDAGRRCAARTPPLKPLNERTRNVLGHR